MKKSPIFVALLLSSGSAICGATAMALVSPLIKAKPQTLLISLAIIFTLNTIAIILFPIIGSYLGMSSYEFGAFSALAIHDTASVIGSALLFDTNSVEVATAIKIMRTLMVDFGYKAQQAGHNLLKKLGVINLFKNNLH